METSKQTSDINEYFWYLKKTLEDFKKSYNNDPEFRKGKTLSCASILVLSIYGLEKLAVLKMEDILYVLEIKRTPQNYMGLFFLWSYLIQAGYAYLGNEACQRAIATMDKSPQFSKDIYSHYTPKNANLPDFSLNFIHYTLTRAED